jgi:hypothetical protein
MKSNAKGKKPPISAGSEDDDNGISLLSYMKLF